MLIKFGMNYPQSGECRSREWFFKHALGNKILHCILLEHLLEFSIQLGSKRFIICYNESGFLQFLNDIRRRKCLAGTRNPSKVWNWLPSLKPLTISAMAWGWSPVGSYSLWSLKIFCASCTKTTSKFYIQKVRLFASNSSRASIYFLPKMLLDKFRSPLPIFRTIRIY